MLNPPPPPATARRSPTLSAALGARSIIAGREAAGTDHPAAGSDARSLRFRAIKPITGEEIEPTFVCATKALTESAAASAAFAFNAPSQPTVSARAALLEAVASELDLVHETLLIRAAAETGYSHQRLEREFLRTTSTLRMFGRLIAAGDWPHPIIDNARAQPDLSQPNAPDVRRTLIPLGPVAVFGASNFPLAYGVAGGDTASALAAGCPVIVKGHPAHPGTGELVARAVARGIERAAINPGFFSYLHSGGDNERSVGRDIVGHPAIKAVGFTGSFAGGMALSDMAASRPEPIPVFAEMGSVNPVFVLAGALERADEIADSLAVSILDSSGQQCTCPGLIFVQVDEANPNDPGAAFIGAMNKRFEGLRPVPMLSQRTADLYRARVNAVSAAADGFRSVHGARSASRPSARQLASLTVDPILLHASLDGFRAGETLREEIFGPAAIIIPCPGPDEVLDAASTLPGSLTGAIFAGPGDTDLARRLIAIVQRRIGRFIYNGVPTGVRVCEAMVHGGPQPASNRPDTTAVGPHAITRWTRPICYQNTPDELLPPELQNANPLRLRRRVNGVITDRALTVR